MGEDLPARTSHKRAREEGELVGGAADGSSPIVEPASQAEPAPESAAAAASQQPAEAVVERGEGLPSGPAAAELAALRHELSGLAGAAQAAGQVDEACASACAPGLQALVACCCASAGGAPRAWGETRGGCSLGACTWGCSLGTCTRGLPARPSMSRKPPPTRPGARAAFEAVGLAEAPEPALTVVAPHFAAAECSGRAAARFVGAVLLPRVRALVKPASRALFHVALSLIAHHPRALGDELLLPLMRLPGGGGGGGGGAAAARGATPQAEAAGRLLKEMPATELSRLLRLFLRGGGGGEGGGDTGGGGEGASQPSAWSEAQVELLEKVLSQRPVLPAEELRELLQQVDANVDALRASVKFGQLLLTLARGYGGQLDRHQLSLAKRVTEQLEKGFVKKPALAALAKQEAALGAAAG